MTKPRPISTPLSDDEYAKLADLLHAHSPFDIDGVLGVLYAVTIAPGFVPPSRWIPVVFPDGMRGLDEEGAEEVLGLLIRLHDEIATALAKRRVMMPAEDEIEACDSFAAGFLAGAEADPEWVNNDAHWTFTSWAAYLAGKPELIAPDLLQKFQEDPNIRPTIYKSMVASVVTAHDVFLEVRRNALSEAVWALQASTARRVGRNEPCPCGSGKKFKRCCIDRRAMAPH